MTIKEFCEEIRSMTENFEEPCDLDVVLTEDAYKIFQELEAGEYVKKAATEKKTDKITEKGRVLLDYMQENYDSASNEFESKVIAEALNIAGRSVSGSIRSLCTNGYVKKISESPIKYALTEKGKTA